MNEIRESITPEIRKNVDLSFDIADRIHTILQRKGITQREFAKQMGKKESEISKWLSGSHNFTIHTIAQIETILGDSIIEIVRPPESKINAVIKDVLDYNQVYVLSTELYPFPVTLLYKEWKNSFPPAYQATCGKS